MLPCNVCFCDFESVVALPTGSNSLSLLLKKETTTTKLLLPLSLFDRIFFITIDPSSPKLLPIIYLSQNNGKDKFSSPSASHWVTCPIRIHFIVPHQPIGISYQRER
jgi:hypothetical protein